MRAHNVIIITSGSANLARTGELDALVDGVIKMNKNPILVLGPDGDDILRYCRGIDECDVVFDPNYQGGLFSGIKAGLQATNGAAFVISAHCGTPDATLWERLEGELLREESTQLVDVFQMATQEAKAHPSFPVLVTPRGVKTLVALPSTLDWSLGEGFTVRQVADQAMAS